MAGKDSMTNKPETSLPADVIQDIENAAKLYAEYGQLGPVSIKEAKYLIHKGASTEWANKWWEVKQCLEAQDANVEILLRKSERLQEENERLKAALEWIKTYGPVDKLTVQFIDKALAEKGKEVTNG